MFYDVFSQLKLDSSFKNKVFSILIHCRGIVGKTEKQNKNNNNDSKTVKCEKTNILIMLYCKCNKSVIILKIDK